LRLLFYFGVKSQSQDESRTFLVGDSLDERSDDSCAEIFIAKHNSPGFAITRQDPSKRSNSLFVDA